MNERATDELVRDLTRDLEPVTPVPRLRSAALLATAAWAGGVVASWLVGAPRPDPGWLSGDAVFLVVLGGLTLAAGGGLAAGLASAVPGRETTARAGAGSLAAGLALVLGAAAFAGGAGHAFAGDLPCAVRATALGVAPALVASVYLARAFALRPLRAAAAAAVGGASLGGVAVHVSCSMSGIAAHAAIGHCLGPLVLVVAATVALALRWSRRAGHAPRPA